MPGPINIRGNWLVSGNYRFRLGFWGKVVLQVEELAKTGHTDGPNHVWTGQMKRWRDAEFFDLQNNFINLVKFDG